METIEALFILCALLVLPFAVLTAGCWYLEQCARKPMATMNDEFEETWRRR